MSNQTLNFVTQFDELKDIQPTTIIPVADSLAWQMYPRYNWVYDKLLLTQADGVDCGPIGIDPQPKDLPVIYKPIINVEGGGIGAFQVTSLTQIPEPEQFPGYFWSPLVPNTPEAPQHRSIDVPVATTGSTQQVFGPKFCWVGVENQSETGVFDYWYRDNNIPQSVNNTIDRFIFNYLPSFHGVINFEVRGNLIIECHLRLGDMHWHGDPELIQLIVDLYDRNYTNIHSLFDTLNDIAQAQRHAPRMQIPVWGITGHYQYDNQKIQRMVENDNAIDMYWIDVEHDQSLYPGDGFYQRLMIFTYDGTIGDEQVIWNLNRGFQKAFERTNTV